MNYNINMHGGKINIRERRKNETEIIKEFLNNQGIMYEEPLDYTVIAEQGGRMVGTGSLYGNIMKCVAVDKSMRGQDMLSVIVTHLIKVAFKNGFDNIVVYTRPENRPFFESVGFKLLAECPPYYVWLELGGGIDEYRHYLLEQAFDNAYEKDIGAVVINANPFTKGHQFLIDQASKMSDFLYVFLVQRDKFPFPYRDRKSIVEQVFKDRKSIKVLRTGGYMDSSAIVPTYFLKETERDLDIEQVRACLDTSLFVIHIAPTIGIKKRFIGKPLSACKSNPYTAAIKKILPSSGIQVVEIPRKKSEDGRPISASRVRMLLKNNMCERLEDLVPPITYKYLCSEKGKEIVQKLKESAPWGFYRQEKDDTKSS